MERTTLNHREDYPDDVLLGRVLGDAKTVWDLFLAYLDREHPDFLREWRFYKDGNAWLYKVTKKRKTICWVSVFDRKFKTTFYFPDRAEEIIKSSALDPNHVNRFVNGRHYGKTRGLTIDILREADLEATKILIGIRMSMK